MPHQCTGCGRAFDDGSKEMLSGCPECGGNKFQFKPQSAIGEQTGAANTGGGDGGSGTPIAETDDRDSPSERASGSATSSDTPPRSRSRDELADGTDDRRGRSSEQHDVSNGEVVRVDDESPDEDDAQANARSNVVSRDELTEARASLEDGTHAVDSANGGANAVPSGETESDAAAAERPALDDLREELNDQFESIKIVSPGKYELNLMELYDRQECIISLQEDGRYVIEMPDSWDDREE